MTPSRRRKTPVTPPSTPDAAASFLPGTPSERAPWFRSMLKDLDFACLFFSPMAALVFIVLSIVTLDEFGQYVQFRRAIQLDGVESVGTYSAPSPGSKYIYVSFAGEENGTSSILLPVQYYTQATLARFKDGQSVRVRYVFPPEHEYKGVLVDAYDDVLAYTGYISGKIWIFLICWLLIAIHPEWLMFGLADPPPDTFKYRKTA